MAINDAAFGPEHPEIVADLVGLAALQRRDRDVDAAAPALARARRILDAQGEATVERFLLLRTEAELAHHRGRRGEAIAGLRAALAFASGRDDVEAIDRADAELALATLLAGERGGRGDALALAEAAATTFGDATTPYGRARAAEAAALLARLRP
ncbi:MAG: hypothetical protein H6710_21970 [Myxococcales bacterium]|nr:hypothetical protein [Myxococcales bacterium]